MANTSTYHAYAIFGNVNSCYIVKYSLFYSCVLLHIKMINILNIILTCIIEHNILDALNILWLFERISESYIGL